MSATTQFLVCCLAMLGAFSVTYQLYRWVTPRPEGELPNRVVDARPHSEVDLLALIANHLTHSITTDNHVQLLIPKLTNTTNLSRHTCVIFTLKTR